MNERTDYDWIVIGSGFGGSAAALRLAEKGYRVALVEQGRRYAEKDLPRSSSDWRFLWAPRLGLTGLMRLTIFRHVASAAQTGVGGGSLVYGGVLYRAQRPFYSDAQWADLGNWEARLAPHYDTAERMTGVTRTPWESTSSALTRQIADRFATPDAYAKAPVGVFFGEPLKTYPDPYFGGDGPDRTACLRCGQCMIGCRYGAVNNLTKNYLWFAEKLGVQIIPERMVVDVAPLGAADGSDGYRVSAMDATRPRRRSRTSWTAGGVVFAAGTVGTNTLLANCKHTGSLPRISDHLGRLVRTNSEVCLSVLLPEGYEPWRDVTTSSRAILDGDTQVELLTYGPYGDLEGLGFTALVGDGPWWKRQQQLAAAVLRDPVGVASMWRRGWSSRALVLLVMQARDNALTFRATRQRNGRYRLRTQGDPVRPAPRHLQVAQEVAEFVAAQTGGQAQSSISEALADAPMTAHMIGGAVIGATPDQGVVDENLRVHGYENLIVCDASALPANPGVNPALTILAVAEHAMSRVAGR